MTKPWEETWGCGGFGDVYRVDNAADATGPQRVFRVDGDTSTREEDEARAKLSACAPEMARLLLFTEYDRLGECLLCTGDGDHGHDEGCDWLALMKKAGIR